MRITGIRFITLICILIPSLLSILSVTFAAQDEEELGRKYSRDIEEQSKIVTDPAIMERVDKIGQALAKIANEQEVPARYGSSAISKFKYTFKVIEDKDINAFSLPGGLIYVNTGLLEAVESDDELAGVLAHEIAHASHHHMSQIIEKQSRVDHIVAILAVAGILCNMRGNDFNNLLYGAQLMRTGKVSGYTMEAEKDADQTAVIYMSKSQYNPHGILTFMRKLEAKHDANPTLPLGIYQTHPSPFRRVNAIVHQMKAQGIAVDQREIRDTIYAKSIPSEDGSNRYKVVIGKKTLYEPAALKSGKTSKERADIIVDNINKLLDSGITSRDLNQDKSRTSLLAKGIEILKVETADSISSGNDTQTLLNNARSTLKYAVWASWLCDRCPVVQQAESDESE